MDLLSRAVDFAVDAFDGRNRKSSQTPMLIHSLEAATIAASMTDDVEVMAAAVLHDVIEDAGVTAEEIRERFGERVCELVASDTEDKREGLPSESTWKLRKQETIDFLRSTDDKDVKILVLGDKLSNIRAIHKDLLRCGDALWQRFNQKNPEEHHWYYRTIADELSDLKDCPAWQEYDRLVRAVFE